MNSPVSGRDMVDVEIVYAHDPDIDGPDTNRIGTIESYPKSVARGMVNSGEARWPLGSAQAKPLEAMGRAELVSEARVRGIAIDPRGTRTQIFETVSAAVAEQTAVVEEEQRETLEHLTKDQLREQYQAAADAPSNATKADLIAAVEEAQAAEPAAEPVENADEPGPVTVAPGAEHNPNRDQTNP